MCIRDRGTLLTTYCYWGYYNICFLGGEVRRPEKTIPRAILLSVLFVAAFYVTMDLAVLPSLRDAAAHTTESALVRVRLVAEIAHSAFGGWAGYLMAALIIWTAFASVFSLLLGYSRVPYAAAQSGNYFRFLAAVHPRHGIPHRSLVALGLVASGFCFFSLQQVITIDVYKRQHRSRRWFPELPLQPCLPPGSSIAPVERHRSRRAPVAVSYTHLDVYKRQR